ncbi:MAG: protein nirF [Haliea sp.]|jgi:protein NirF|nr:protein nirF [Haliea sp.]
MKRLARLILAIQLCLSLPAHSAQLRGTGDLGIVIERASGSVLVVEHSNDSILHRIEGLGDLSHASAVYSRDARYAFVFGRDGGLTKIDLLTGKIDKRIIQGGNAIGGAISQDGSLVAVSNYEPGGVKVFSTADLSLVADIPARAQADGEASKTVGLVDAPGQRFVYSLFNADQIWIVDMSDPTRPAIEKFEDIGSMPYDGLISANGRTYMAGLFGEDGLAMLDLWQPEDGVKKVLPDYGRGEERLPVYKMPHLEGWAMTDKHAFLPAVGHHRVLVVNRDNWSEAARIEVKGQPVFVMARPDGRQVWVNFAYPDNQWIQVIDVPTMQVVHTLDVGKGALHMEFTPRGEKVWISVRDEDQVKIFDTANASLQKTLPAGKPSGIFFTNRAGRTGL